MKQVELDIIKARCEAATPGPWTWHIGGGHDWLGPEGGPAVLDDGSAAGEYQQVIAGDSPDGEFIAHAREDIPMLVAEVERLRAEVIQLQADRKLCFEEWSAEATQLQAEVTQLRAKQKAEIERLQARLFKSLDE